MSKFTEGKKTRTAVLVLCGAMLAVLPAMAQQDAPPPPPQDQTQGPPPDGGMHGRGGMGPEHRVEMLKHELNLTPEQTMQVKGIFEEGRGKMEALRADNSVPPEDRRMKMMELRKHESEHIRSILTPEQQPKYDAIVARERERERMRDHREGGPDGPPPPPQQ